MKSRTLFTKILASILCIAMLCGVIPFMSLAAGSEAFVSETHDVFKHTESILAPGVEQSIKYAYAKDGKQMVYYVTTADINRDDVIVQTSYSQQYRDGVYAMAKLTDQAASANEYYSDKNSKQFISEYYNVVAGVNGSFYNMTTGQPTGVAYIDGVSIGTATYDNFFAILKDGTPVIDYRSNLSKYTGEKAIWQAVAGNQWLIRDGADITATSTGSYSLDRHCRTSVGITADGKVVTMVLDGRQEPFSCGGSMHEVAQIMLEAGCVAAINLDGGGSTTYIAKQEGEDTLSIVNRPSDGSERAISTGLIIASTAAPSNVFERATLTSDSDYITVNAQAVIDVKGISPAGTAAEVPSDAYLTLADASMGSVSGNIFTPAKTGDAVIQLVYNGAVVGETTVHVVVPDMIAFEVTSLAVPYGQTTDILVAPTFGDFKYDVKFAADDVAFTFDSTYGTVDGLKFTATSDTSVTEEGSITVTVVGTEVSATVPINVGKGSEVLFDFEDGTTTGWDWFDYYNADVSTTIKPVDATTGKVHSGNYAMAYTMDFSQLTYYEDYIVSMMTYNAASIKDHGLTNDADGVSMYGTMDDYVNITGATRIGFWVYIPDEIDVSGLNPRFTFAYKKTATSEWTRGTSDMSKFLVDRDGMGSDGWYYFSADLSAFSSYYIMTMQNNRLTSTSNKNGYKNERYYGTVVEWYVEDRAWKSNQTKSYNGKMTVYIDDITVDYSSVVADREAPVFSNISYASFGMSDSTVLKDDAVMTGNVIDFTASVAENTAKTNATGINASTAKAYVDGNEVTATYVNGRISIDSAVTFADGVHTVKFEIADNQGNASYIKKTFTVNSGSAANTVKIVPHNTDLTSTLVGSLYYIDVVATDISTVKNVSVTLKVNNVNEWQPEGIISNSAFDVSYTKDASDEGVITLTVTKTGETTETGEAILASIPIRTWYPHNALGKNSTWIITTKKCVYPMDTQLLTKAGSVEFTDGTASTFSAAKIQIDSEAMCAVGYIGVNKGNEGGTTKVTSWHEHVETAVADLPATCTTAGYTGRTYCNGCASYVNWGTTVPAMGHSYELVNGQFVCTVCEDAYEAGTGLFEMNEKWYYSVSGKFMTGWRQIDGVWYYFGADYAAYTGEKEVDGRNYIFGENGAITEGQWFVVNGYTRYYIGPEYPRAAGGATLTLKTIGGDIYGFDRNGNKITGMFAGCLSYSVPLTLYRFDENGVLLGEGPENDGFVKCQDGTRYYKDGKMVTGLNIIENKYYYFSIHDGAMRTGDYTVNPLNSNGLFETDMTFHFDETTGAADIKTETGFKVENGNTYYYLSDGSRAVGLHLIDGKYYYFSIHTAAMRTGDYTVNPLNSNGLFDKDMTFHFDETTGAADIKTETGFKVENGNTYYYLSDGNRAVGLHLIDGKYYYFSIHTAAMRTGDYTVNPLNSNGLFDKDMTFHFDEANGYAVDENGSPLITEN